jgi:hypothetical protein
VAVVGVIFFGALHHGVGHAFELSVAALAAVLLGLLAITRLIPASEVTA